jgi:hypothetical protein
LLLWIFSVIPVANRWYPIFLRYIGALADQITVLGGDPSAIPPSATGIWPGSPPWPGTGKGKGVPKGGPGKHRQRVGKIAGLVYDHFGDFEGFILETGDGQLFTFLSRETHVEALVDRACGERLRVTVISEHHDEDRPRRIILHHAASPVL